MAGNELGSPEQPRPEAAAGRVLLEAEAIERAISRIAHEIVERNPDGGIALVAIAEGGVPVGERLAERLADLRGEKVSLDVLDVTLYRDDVIAGRKRPLPHKTRMTQSVTGRRVILVEDVVFTGRTVRAAMDAVIDFGRPEAIQVATLVDRGHRELPIRVDYVGKNVPTARSDRVTLRPRGDGELEVVIE